jgi:hypothetical protein
MRLSICLFLAISFTSSCATNGETNQRALGAREGGYESVVSVVEKSAPSSVPKDLNPAGVTSITTLSTTVPTTAVPSPSVHSEATADLTQDACAQLSSETSYGANLAGASEVFGYSAEGEPLLVEHYGSRSGPQILVVGQVHGNECSPALFVKAMRDLDPSSWGVYLLPTLNPDGLKELERRSSGVDLNRDGFNLVSLEARALMDFTASRDLFLTIHVHSPNGWVGYHGTNRAIDLARVLSDSMGQSFLRSAGSGRGFLWEGQAKRVEGHQSVLVELPAVFSQEAPSALERVQYSLEEVSSMVERMTKALLEYMNQEANDWSVTTASK